ncbi:hypothetical protein FACS189472_12720 [Alphaproteobacteria bacterium]|nr:hypothetical protein FACS189472_12720 [Alphaproteobacteria bacterium]
MPIATRLQHLQELLSWSIKIFAAPTITALDGDTLEQMKADLPKHSDILVDKDDRLPESLRIALWLEIGLIQKLISEVRFPWEEPQKTEKSASS